jgi:hypothetical protein
MCSSYNNGGDDKAADVKDVCRSDRVEVGQRLPANYVALQLTPMANLRGYRMMIDIGAMLNYQ